MRPNDEGLPEAPGARAGRERPGSTLSLTDADRADLAGESGPGTRLAMSIVCRMAEIVGAERLLDIGGAHIDSSLYQGPATLEFAERLAEGGARVRVPTTLNVAGIDQHGWHDWAVPEDWAEPARRQMEAYERMGCRATWTCAPYQTEPRPARGEDVAWGESSAIVFANSVLGARTERYPDLLDICCAVTGRVPAAGLHLPENRIASILVDLSGIPARLAEDASLFPVLGHWIGARVGQGVPLLDGLDIRPDEDALKALGAAMASSGAVALFHWAGVTPEAADARTAGGGGGPDRRLAPTLADLREARADLGGGEEGQRLDLVVLGSPHFSLAEIGSLAGRVRGHRRHPDTRLLVTTGRAVREVARRAGHLEALEAFGAEITVDTCILTSPMLPDDVASLMTNSAKYAYYAPSLLDRRIAFGGLDDCVASAIAGRVTRVGGAWS